MLDLGLGLQAKIFGVGLENPGLGLGLGLEDQGQALAKPWCGFEAQGLGSVSFGILNISNL